MTYGMIIFAQAGILLLAVAEVAQSPDPVSGGAGWVGAGLLGAVLSWLLLVYLPTKDKQDVKVIDTKDLQIKEMIANQVAERNALVEKYDKEREVERDARHKRNNDFQVMMNNSTVTFQKALKDIQDEGRREAQLDRAALVTHSTAIEKAINQQTFDLKSALLDALKGVCRSGTSSKPDCPA